jgi:hypothetical protein
MVVNIGVRMVLAFVSVDRMCGKCLENILASSSEVLPFCYFYKLTQDLLDCNALIYECPIYNYRTVSVINYPY